MIKYASTNLKRISCCYKTKLYVTLYYEYVLYLEWKLKNMHTPRSP